VQQVSLTDSVQGRI